MILQMLNKMLLSKLKNSLPKILHCLFKDRLQIIEEGKGAVISLADVALHTGTGAYCQYFHFHNRNVANVWKNNLALWTKRNQENISPRCWLGRYRENLCENMDYTFFAEKYFKQLMWFALPVALLEPWYN